jgi:hypothetical protein
VHDRQGNSIHYFLKEVGYADMERFTVELEIISRSFRNRCFDQQLRYRCRWEEFSPKLYLDDVLDIPNDRSMENLEVESSATISNIHSSKYCGLANYG